MMHLATPAYAKRLRESCMGGRGCQSSSSPNDNTSHEDMIPEWLLPPMTVGGAAVVQHTSAALLTSNTHGRQLTQSLCRVLRTLQRQSPHLRRRKHTMASRADYTPIRQPSRRKVRAHVEESSLQCAYAGG